MPRKRSKPVAEHIESQNEEPSSAPTEAPAREPTLAPTESPTGVAAEPTAQVTPEDVKTKPLQADPFKQDEIALGEGKDAPRMHLWRSNKYQQTAISFDERPEEKYLDQLREAGFGYRSVEKVWTKQFMSKDEFNAMDEQERAGRRARRQFEAKALFVDIANAIRADKGLEPVHAIGM